MSSISTLPICRAWQRSWASASFFNAAPDAIRDWLLQRRPARKDCRRRHGKQDRSFLKVRYYLFGAMSPQVFGQNCLASLLTQGGAPSLVPQERLNLAGKTFPVVLDEMHTILEMLSDGAKPIAEPRFGAVDQNRPGTCHRFQNSGMHLKRTDMGDDAGRV